MEKLTPLDAKVLAEVRHMARAGASNEYIAERLGITVAQVGIVTCRLPLTSLPSPTKGSHRYPNANPRWLWREFANAGIPVMHTGEMALDDDQRPTNFTVDRRYSGGWCE